MSDGVRHCERVIESLRGTGGCVVFDVDNTLVDARGRTRAAWASFRRENRCAVPRRIPLRCIGWDGAATARRLRLGKKASAAFAAHWERFFWNPRNLHHDTRIRKTMRLARLAAEAELEVYYVTGRVEQLKAATIRELADKGLPFADKQHVICKPAISLPTTDFKIDALGRLGKQQTIGWYMTDSRCEIASLQRKLNLPCVLVDFPVSSPAWARVAPGTPRIVISRPRPGPPARDAPRDPGAQRPWSAKRNKRQ
jgi:hypothetical protein